MERAADRFGISHHGLFADSTFIARTTGQRWADRAKRDGRQEGIGDGFLMGWRAASGKGPFSRLRGKLWLDQPATSAAHAMVRALIAAYKDRGEKSEPAPRDRMAGLNQPDLGPGGAEEVPSVSNPKVLAAAILRAAEKSRGGFGNT